MPHTVHFAGLDATSTAILQGFTVAERQHIRETMQTTYDIQNTSAALLVCGQKGIEISVGAGKYEFYFSPGGQAIVGQPGYYVLTINKIRHL